jgi:hypothetical protein
MCDSVRYQSEEPARGDLEPDCVRCALVFVTYVMVHGFTGYVTMLDKVDPPFNVLARFAHVEFLQILLSLGAMFRLSHRHSRA